MLGKALTVALLAMLAGTTLFAHAASTPVAAATCAPEERYFPETQHCVGQLFAEYWANHGGLAQQGYPISDEFVETSAIDGKPYRVQYFERARFERHPENAPPYNVLLGLLGTEQKTGKYPAGSPRRPGECLSGEQLFPQTGHCVSAIFAEYWANHGGLAQQGYPISDEFVETSAIDGKPYRVQYFERARFEHHPENAPPFAVLLGLLGYEQVQAKYPSGTPLAVPTPGGTVIYRDAFTDPGSGWPLIADPRTGLAAYENGGYRVVITATDALLFPVNTKVGDLADVRIEVDVTKGGGPSDAFFGLQCRADTIDNLYAFVIDATGYAAIYRTTGGKATLLAATEAASSPALRTGNATNRLRADCIGTTLALYANGQKVLEARDGTLSSGAIGFATVTFDRGGLEVVYRNLVVSKP